MTEKEPRKKYIVVIEASSHELENLVNEWIQDGYLPLGGVCVYVMPFPFPDGGHRLRFVQAMMKRQGG